MIKHLNLISKVKKKKRKKDCIITTKADKVGKQTRWTIHVQGLVRLYSPGKI